MKGLGSGIKEFKDATKDKTSSNSKKIKTILILNHNYS